MSHHTNIVRIKGVYHALRELGKQVVFVGGATVSLYADKPEHADVRPTNDVDVLVEIATYGEFAKVQEKLNELGFEVDAESNVICRYKHQGLIVDVMPTEEDVLGFKNKWYPEGFVNKEIIALDEHVSVNIFTAPYFIASKLEAFGDRGGNDGRTSSDFEDIIFVLDNRDSIWEEIERSNDKVKEYLKDEFKKLIENQYAEEWISAHLEYQTVAARARRILGAMARLIG
ncbi:MAG: hypothetical protein BGO69_18795 [Bacteroidetes bacterium 46-16]|mgnify:CR=1 FL=1|nr:MAG: hypothetical protein BGO69_18795 [Bacteroidetes bacterium 46-16]